MPEALDKQAQSDCHQIVDGDSHQTSDVAEQFQKHFGKGLIW